MTDIPRNVVIITQDTDSKILTKTSKFCLDVAFHRDGYVDEIWVLSPGYKPIETDNAQFARWDAKSQVRHFHLDAEIWPMDVGNNLYLRSPLCAYAALRTFPIAKDIYLPLQGGSAFFALQARKGGLIPETTKFIITCYLPHRLKQPGSLTLPEHINNVVDCELEEHCAAHMDEFWISHQSLEDNLSKIFNLMAKDKIFSLPLPAAAKPLRQASRHIIFAGPPIPLYGFDAFCDLAEQLKDEVEEVSVFLQTTSDKKALKRAKAAQKRLSQLGITLNWRYVDNPIQALDGSNDGVFVALMRAPFLPSEARAAIGAGLTTLWGTGFDISLPDMKTPELYAVVSEARKAAAALKTLWGDPESAHQESVAKKPLLITPPSKAIKKNVAPKPLPPINSLSIIVTHHNRPEFLKQCLRSLEHQIVSDFEVIIVDDGSRSNIVDQVETIVANSSLTSIQLTKIENSYPAAARNHGAKLAQGDVLFFVDDDNILDPRAVSALRQAITHHDLALSFYQTFKGEVPTFNSNRENPNRAELHGPSYGFAGLLPGCGLFHNLTGNASLMIRRNAFEQLGGFTTKYGIGLEDYALMLKAAFRGNLKWVVLPEAYLHFRLHENKIRNSHVDWKNPVRLQAGHWRVIEGLHKENSSLPSAALAYARQLHELTQFTYVAAKRPKYFRIRSIILHQYIRPFLSRQIGLRLRVVKFTSGESRLAKRFESWFF